MGKGIAFLIWLCCSSLALGQLNGHFFLDEASSTVPTYDDPEVYAVYSVVINSILLQPNFQQETTIAIDDQTATEMEICTTPNKAGKAKLASVIANYVKVNKVERRLLPRFILDKPYELVQSSPNGLYLSSIGFNHRKTLAVVSVFAGSGHNYFLVKNNGKWDFLKTNWLDAGCVWAS